MDVIEEIKSVSSLDLLTYIGWKEEYEDEAEAAFSQFCLRYDQAVFRAAEIYCCKWELSETVALDIVKCTFARVWKYPTYCHEKSKSKNIDSGIKRWLNRIVYTQLANYTDKGSCYEPDAKTDLSLIYTVDELIDKTTEDKIKRKELRERLNILYDAMAKLGEKHRIIYLTYKLYAPKGRNIPRPVNKKLQEELGLVSGSIRKYKEQAIKQVENFINRNNGN